MATIRQKAAARQNIKKAQPLSHRPARPVGGELTEHRRNELEDARFAFPEQRKEPLNDAEHVRNAVARFDQVEDVSDADRDQAWKRIKAAARKFGVDIE